MRTNALKKTKRVIGIDIKKNGNRLYELVKKELESGDNRIDIKKVKICSNYKCKKSPQSTEGFKRPCVFCFHDEVHIELTRMHDCPLNAREVVNKLISIEEISDKNSEW